MPSTCQSPSQVYPSLTNPLHTNQQQAHITQRLTGTEEDAAADELPTRMFLWHMHVVTMRAAHDVNQGLIYIHRRRLAHKLLSSTSSENRKSMRKPKSSDGDNAAAVLWSCKPTSSE